jgi:hypothetical protein
MAQTKTPATRAAAPAKTKRAAAPAGKPPKAMTAAKQPKAAPVAKQLNGAAAAETEAKREKLKLMRDSFTMPALEYAAIGELKARAAKLARPAKKSELLRAGIKLLSDMSDKQLLAALAAVPPIKTGRPKSK